MTETAFTDRLKQLWHRYKDGAALAAPAETTERTLIENIEDLVEWTAEDVMVPRADIVAVEVGASTEEFLQLIRTTPHTRIPVYQGALDDILGFVHIKDILQMLAQNRMGGEIHLRDLLREVMIVSPALPALDLLVEMRKSHRNLAMVIDEYGGIDGLITLGDLVSAIVGEINDEHKLHKSPRMLEKSDGTILVDARFALDDFEKQFGDILTEEEREEADTLGGLAMFLASRLPKRGELLTHPSGMQIEVMDADARQVKRLRLRNLPQHQGTGDQPALETDAA